MDRIVRRGEGVIDESIEKECMLLLSLVVMSDSRWIRGLNSAHWAEEQYLGSVGKRGKEKEKKKSSGLLHSKSMMERGLSPSM